MSAQGQKKGNEVNAQTLGQGIFVQKDSTVTENIYVSVTKTDISSGSSLWYDKSSESAGITWTGLSTGVTADTTFKRASGWEVVVFKDENDTQRKVLYFNVKSDTRAQSNIITFCGWYENGIVIEKVPN